MMATQVCACPMAVYLQGLAFSVHLCFGCLKGYVPRADVFDCCTQCLVLQLSVIELTCTSSHVFCLSKDPEGYILKSRLQAAAAILMQLHWAGPHDHAASTFMPPKGYWKQDFVWVHACLKPPYTRKRRSSNFGPQRTNLALRRMQLSVAGHLHRVRNTACAVGKRLVQDSIYKHLL